MWPPRRSCGHVVPQNALATTGGQLDNGGEDRGICHRLHEECATHHPLLLAPQRGLGGTIRRADVDG